MAPDGICLHHDGETIWMANALRNEVARIARGGRVVQRVRTSQQTLDCVLGGAGGTGGAGGPIGALSALTARLGRNRPPGDPEPADPAPFGAEQRWRAALGVAGGLGVGSLLCSATMRSASPV